MRIAILSDIHGNHDALKEVLRDIEECNVDKIISIGDQVDYGPESEKVITTLKERNIPMLLGNHEVALWDYSIFSWSSSIARESTDITRKLLKKETIEFLKTLPVKLEIDEIYFVHGAPPESVTEYIIHLPDEELIRFFRRTKFKIVFVGHTHSLDLYETDCIRHVNIKELKKGNNILDKKKRYVVNVGSVGQPRDSNKAAKYVIYKSIQHSVDVRHVEYDSERTVKLIRELGYPEYNAELIED